MKTFKFLLLGSAIVLSSLHGFAQDDTTKKPYPDTTRPRPDSPMQVQSQSFPVNPLAPITRTAPLEEFKPSAPAPNAGKYYIPAIGHYEATVESPVKTAIAVKVDEQNPGKLWIEGLTDEPVYAVLKAVPGTYKIPAQGVEGKKTGEGVLLYNDGTKQINIGIGCGYVEADPASALNKEAQAEEPAVAKTSKNSKKKHIVKKVQIISFSGNKTDVGTAQVQ